MSVECKHKFNGKIKCSRKKGHELDHREYVNTGTDNNPVLRIYRWDDAGKPIPMFVEQGNAFEFHKGEDPQKIMNLAIHEATSVLEKGDVFEIRRKISTKDEVDGIAWYRVPEQKYYKERATRTEPLLNLGVEGKYSEYGYILLARIKV